MNCTARKKPLRLVIVVVFTLVVARVSYGQKIPSWSGFAILGGASQSEGVLAADPLSVQLQIGVDWYPSPAFGAHVHLLGRSDSGDSINGAIGVAEAFLEANLFSRAGRLRLRGGAMFLPTSFENVDALWENPFTISSSALNTWFGEEFRPIGIDATYSKHGFMVGATLFRGNDTFGALPPARGWALSDRWTLLGQKVSVNARSVTSVSAETDRRLGWSARTGWTGQHLSAQYTYIDNRSDGQRYDDLSNWNTKFHIVGGGYSIGAWTIAAETGWGPTFLFVRGQPRVSDIRATYALVSHRFSHGRASFRADSYDDGDLRDEALTFTYIWMPTRKLRTAAEFVTTGSTNRAQIELRYSLSRW